MKKAIETIYTESLRLTLQNQLSTMTEFLPVWEHQVRVTALAGTLARELRLDVKKLNSLLPCTTWENSPGQENFSTSQINSLPRKTGILSLHIPEKVWR